ncbi:hypothetical protein [Aliikangiella maris]|uniref:Lipoprotein n=2 Tax=Aliikangiella maris TaxID=3162458 RepID=A0ABV2BSV1_9GAMM
MFNLIKNAIIVGCLIFILGCGANKALINKKLTNHQSNPPTEIVVLQPDVKVFRFTAGGAVEEVPEWGQMSTQSFSSAINLLQKERQDIQIKNHPQLTAEEQKILDEHIALYRVVGPAAVNYGAMWDHKKKNFDYSIGPGLSFLREKINSDTILFINAVDVRSTGGRAALAVGVAILGIGIPMGGSNIYMSIVELETGDILWSSNDISPPNFDNIQSLKKYFGSSVDDYLAFYQPSKKKVAQSKKQSN